MTAGGGLEMWHDMVSYVGEDLAGFMLDTESCTDTDSFSQAQFKTAISISLMLSNHPLHEWDPVRRGNLIATLLCSYFPDWGNTPASSLHLFSSGSMPDTASTDPLEQALAELAVDVYPTFLSPVAPLRSAWAPQISSHPKFQAIQTLMFQADEPLMRLFPDADFSLPIESVNGTTDSLTRFAHFSDGSAGELYFGALIQCILQAASGGWSAGESGLESYVKSVRQSLGDARNLARGEEISVQGFVGCYNAQLAAGTEEIALDKGRFRRQTPSEVAATKQGSLDQVVFELPVKLKIMEKSPTNDELSSTQESIRQAVSRARMAALLCSVDGNVLAIGEDFQSWPNPLANGGGLTLSPTQMPRTLRSSPPLSADNEADIREWDSILGDIPIGLKTGQQRLLTAVSERHHPHDAFIDAVVVWETLFGGKAETQLRVCAALAHLLEPDNPEQRYALFLRTKKMYDTRSKLVHGGNHQLSYAQATELRDEALGIALNAWRTILRTESLLKCADSAVRSNMVIMGV